MRQLILVIFLFISAYTVSAQGWGTVGSGLPAPGLLAADSSNVYALVNERLFIWDGNFWTAGPKIPDQGFSADVMLATDSVVYVAGVPGNNQHALWRFNGQSWRSDSVPNFNSVPVHALGGYQNILYLAGSGDNVARFSGGPVTQAPSLGGAETVQFVNNLVVVDDSLYAGTFAYLGTPGTNIIPYGVQKFEPVLNDWKPAANGRRGINSTENNFHLFGLRDTLYAVGNSSPNEVYRKDQDTLVYLGNFNQSFAQAVEFQGQAVILTAGGSLFSFNGSSFTAIAGPTGMTGLGAKDTELFISANQKVYNGINYSHAYRSNNNFGYVQGKAFYDLNGNCQYDTLEVVLSNTRVQIGGQSAFTGINGEYQIAFSSGTYNVDTAVVQSPLGQNLNQSCASPGTINVANNQVTNQSFAFTSSVPQDYQVQFNGNSGWRARHGSSHHYWLDVTNAGGGPVNNLTAEVELPATVNLLGSSLQPSSVSGSVYQFSLGNISPMETKRVKLTIEIDPNLNNAGDSLNFMARLVGLANDFDASDNADTLDQVITAAFDPNDKRASAAYILPSTREIDYHIRFQNTGNDTAVKVVVVDTLDTTLPLNKIIMNSASHNYSISAIGNVLVWEFNNIMLPDSTTDLAGSQGYIRFSAEIDPNLGIGDSVLNDAQIYFDYQKPIFTNKAKTFIVENIGLLEHEKEPNLQIYPNPASDRFIIKNTSNKPEELRIINARGQLVQQKHLKPSETLEINTEYYSNGIYFINSAVDTYKLIVKRQ